MRNKLILSFEIILLILILLLTLPVVLAQNFPMNYYDLPSSSYIPLNGNLNNQSETFTSASYGHNTIPLLSGDLDNDGDSDILHIYTSGGNSNIYLLNEDMAMKDSFPLGYLVTGSPALFDYDNDGTLEIITTHVSTGQVVFAAYNWSQSQSPKFQQEISQSSTASDLTSTSCLKCKDYSSNNRCFTVGINSSQSRVMSWDFESSVSSLILSPEYPGSGTVDRVGACPAIDDTDNDGKDELFTLVGSSIYKCELESDGSLDNCTSFYTKGFSQYRLYSLPIIIWDDKIVFYEYLTWFGGFVKLQAFNEDGSGQLFSYSVDGLTEEVNELIVGKQVVMDIDSDGKDDICAKIVIYHTPEFDPSEYNVELFCLDNLGNVILMYDDFEVGGFSTWQSGRVFSYGGNSYKTDAKYITTENGLLEIYCKGTNCSEGSNVTQIISLPKQFNQAGQLLDINGDGYLELARQKTNSMQFFGDYVIYTSHCNNGIQDGDEIGVDCGGSCKPCVSCNNRIKDGDEIGVDCGGSCPNDCLQLKILAVPLNWASSQEAFNSAVDTQIDFFLNAIPLKECPEKIKVTKLDITKYNFSDFTCSKSNCGVGKIKPFVEKNGINVKDYDHIIGFIQDLSCYPTAGCSNGKDAAWVWTGYDSIAAHEIGHFYGLADEYCSNQAGSTHPYCNDGNEWWWWYGFIPHPPTDINYLDADLGCDPHIGDCCSNCSKGNDPFNPKNDYFICCDGNINEQGGRAIMSFASALGPRAFDNYSKNHLATFTKLNCPSTLKSLGMTATIPNKIIDLNLNVFFNDIVEEKYIHLVDGESNTYFSENGNYNLLINDINNNTLFNYSFERYFDYDGPVIDGINYSVLNLTSFELSLKIPYDNEMYILYLKHENTTIFSRIFNFCNQDGVCNGSETYLSCWQDCKSYSQDGLCLNYTGDGCDPDCAEGIDPDCDIKLFNITLTKGWNLISLPLQPINSSILYIIRDLSGQIVVWYYNASSDEWTVYDTDSPFPWLNTLHTMDYGKAYWLKSTTNQTLTVQGSMVTDYIIGLKTGWNFVGYNISLGIMPEPISSLTTPIVVWAYYTNKDEWKVYDTEAPFPWLNTLTNMTNGRGYWLKSSIEQDWKI